jgi:hypothetical protein
LKVTAATASLQVTAGEFNVAGASEIDGAFGLSGGSLLISNGTLTLAGTSTWSGGGIDLDGHVLINTGSLSVSVFGGGYPAGIYGSVGSNGSGGNQGGLFDNQGSMSELDGARIQGSDGITIKNDGTFIFAGDDAAGQTAFAYLTDNGPAFVNSGSGTVRKSGGANHSTFGITFHNQGGTVQADSGTLIVGGGTNTGGHYNAGTGAQVLLGGNYSGTYTGTGGGIVGLNSNIQIDPAGAIFNFPQGLFQWTSAGIDLDGHQLTNTGFMTWAPTAGGYPAGLYASTAINGGGANQGGTLDNKGTILQPSGVIQGSDGITLLNEGTYKFTGDDGTSTSFAYLADNGPAFVNAATGLVIKTGGNSKSTIGITFQNLTGTVEADVGTLIVGGGTNTGGTYNAHTGAQVLLSGNYSGTLTGSGGGIVGLNTVIEIDAANATFNFPSGMFVWSTAGIDLDGHTLTNIGFMTWATSASGSYPAGLYGSTASNGGGGNQGGLLDNKGTIVQPSGVMQLSDGISVLNEATYNFSGDATISYFGNNPSSFTNAASGLLEKSGGTGFSTIGVPFNNQGGTLLAQTGTLNPGAGSNIGGTYNASAGAVVLLSGSLVGTFTGSGGGKVDLGTNILIAAGNVTFNFPQGYFQWTTNGIDLDGHILTNVAFMTWMPAVSSGYPAGIYAAVATSGSGGNQGGMVDNKGTILAPSSSVQFSDNVTLLNESIYEFSGDSSVIYFGNNMSTFTNTSTGTVRKTGGVNTSTIGIVFNNQNGLISATSGTLNLNTTPAPVPPSC